QKLVNPRTRVNSERFGVSAHVKGDLIIIGSPYANTDFDDAASLTNAGAAWLFKRNPTDERNWLFVDKFAGWGHDRGQNDYLGLEISAHGDTLAIAAPYHNYNVDSRNYMLSAGAVYVYLWNNDS